MSSKRITIAGLTEMVVESTHTRADGSSLHRKLDVPIEELLALVQVGDINPVANTILKRFKELMQPPTEEMVQSQAAPVLAAPVVVAAPSSLPAQVPPPEEQIDCVIDHDENEVSVTSKKLSEAIKEFMDFGDNMDRWKNDKITTEAETDLILLVEILGDRLIGKLTPKMALKFRKVLTKIPK